MFGLARSHVAAAIIALLVAGYFLVGTVLGSGAGNADPNGGAAPSRTPRVVYETLNAESRPALLVLRGSTRAIRDVTVRAETQGRVAATPAIEGGPVARGDILCRLETDARQAVVDQAEAELRAREQEYQGAVTLRERGYRSDNSVAALQAARDAARAQLQRARQELENINIRAPFDGWFDRREAEAGDYLTPGQACGVVVELDPILVTAQVSEQDVAAIEAGMPGRAQLVTGETVEGVVRRVERRADAATRTFRLELAAPNPDGALRSGVTAEIYLALDSRPAHRVPTAVLGLDEAGEIGVRIIGEDGRVRFVRVDLLGDDAEGVWVAGLPDPARVIVLGQDFVEDGAEVIAVERS